MKTILNARVLFVTAVLQAVMALSAASAAPVLVGLWRFNEAGGETAVDSSGLHNDGILYGENGNVPTRVAGQNGFGEAMKFVANGMDHSIVNVAGNSFLKIGMTPDDTWTLAIWAYESTDGTGDYIATYGRFLCQDDGNGIQWDSGAMGDSQVYLWHGTLDAWHFGFGTDTAVAPVFDEWVHWTLVYDGQNLTLYRNGNQGPKGGKVSMAVRASLDWAGYTGAIQIGSQGNMTGREWNGTLDDVAVFKGALAESEVRTIMAGDFTSYLGGVPRIAGQPQDQVANPGWNVELSVAATSALPMHYQWQFKGVSLAGATDSTLKLSSIQNSQAGPYSAVITNAMGSVTSLTAMVTISTPLPPAIVGLWRFDEGSGEQAFDSSGVGNHGVLTNDSGVMPSWVAGRPGFGQALEFINDGFGHSYVDIPANESLRFGMTPNATWSICAWTYEASDGSGNFVANYGRLFSQNGGFGLNFNSGSSVSGDPQYYIWHHSLGAWQQGLGTSSSVTPILDQWIHLALVYDGQTLTVYRDGNQGSHAGKVSLPITAGLDWGGYGSSIQIGTMLNMMGDRNWNGKIDDFSIFTGALSETQVNQVMAGNFSGLTNAHPQLTLATSGGQVVLTWSWGVLQTTDDITGTWVDLPNARSPISATASDPRRFYRVRQ